MYIVYLDVLLQFGAAEKLSEHALGDVSQPRIKNAQFLQVFKCAEIRSSLLEVALLGLHIMCG